MDNPALDTSRRGKERGEIRKKEGEISLPK